jgi:hypothetical protein
MKYRKLLPQPVLNVANVFLLYSKRTICSRLWRRRASLCEQSFLSKELMHL